MLQYGTAQRSRKGMPTPYHSAVLLVPDVPHVEGHKAKGGEPAFNKSHPSFSVRTTEERTRGGVKGWEGMG